MIPLTAQRLLGSDGDRDHGRPDVATVLTLFFVPALYAAWFRVRADETVDAFIEPPEEMEHFVRVVPIRIAAE